MTAEIILKKDGMSLGLRPDLGGCVSFLRFDGVNLLRPLEGNNYRSCASYPLVPFSNRICDARFLWQGREIQLERNFKPEPHAIHGHGWQNAWQVEKITEECVILCYEHPVSDWPWDYIAHQEFSLEAEGVTMKLSVENRSDRPMPAGLGFHPFFLKGSGAELKMRLTAMHQAEGCIPVARDETHPILGLLTSGGPVPEGFDDGFDGWDGVAEITWPDEGRRLIITASQNARNVIFYSPEGRDYFCVEPVTHMTDAINRMGDPDWPDHGLVTLAPGESTALTMRLESAEL
ncbi:aldose 1-epimerase [Aestuariispira insulae]|uniref:Aldose 1-epimerase n=2 Tax=Aestuariispira insulae TaxID=1461337 RepID=A0A3D9HRL5_9PROT|nr:aldose 1-epimerase [Aestuariispira insulae]